MRNVLLAFSLFAFASAAAADFQPFQQAPDFTATDHLGRAISLSSFRGKFVVLEWFNPNCRDVNKHYDTGSIPALQKQYMAKGVVWITIAAGGRKKDTVADAKLKDLVAAKGGVPSSLFTDKDGKIGKLYGVKTTPQVFIIDPAGRIAYQGAIDSISSADPRDVGRAENYVDSTLSGMMSGKPMKYKSTKPYGCPIKN